jgi:hypothetical protein
MRETRRFLISLLLALSLVALPGCGLFSKRVTTDPNAPVQIQTRPLTNAEKIHEARVQIANLADGLDSTIDVKRALFEEKLISQETSSAINTAVLKAVPIVRKVKTALVSLSDFEAGRASIAPLVAQLTALATELTRQLILPELSAAAQAAINGPLEILTKSITRLQNLFAQ